MVHSGLCELIFLFLSSLQNPNEYKITNSDKMTQTSRGQAPVIYIFAILKSILKNVRINPKNLRIKPSQPLITKKLNKFYNDPMNQTSRMWNIFVDACTHYISQFFHRDALKSILASENKSEKDQEDNLEINKEFDLFERFYLLDNKVNKGLRDKREQKKQKLTPQFEKFINTSYLTQTTSILMSIQTSLAKGIYIANLRFFLDLLVTKVSKFVQKASLKSNSNEVSKNPIDSELNEYLVHLMENNEKLPIFVYFARLFEQKFSQTIDLNSNHKQSRSIEEIAVESGIECIETFCQRYMQNDKDVSLEDYMILPENYEEYLKQAKSIEFLIMNKEGNEFNEYMEFILDTRKIFDADSWQQDASNFTVQQKQDTMQKKYFFYLFLVNKIHLSFILDDKEATKNLNQHDCNIQGTIDMTSNEEPAILNIQNEGVKDQENEIENDVKLNNFIEFRCKFQKKFNDFCTQIAYKIQQTNTYCQEIAKMFDADIKPMMNLINSLISQYFHIGENKKNRLGNRENSRPLTEDIHHSITLLHTFIILTLTPHQILKINNFNSEKQQYSHLSNQLAAYPSKIEQSLLLIAQTFRKLKGDWRTGQQFTRLYKCKCGFLYWIGDCGRAWVIANCPKCSRKIGGEQHTLITDDNENEENQQSPDRAEVDVENLQVVDIQENVQVDYSEINRNPDNAEIENMDLEQQASNYVNRILVGQAGEVTKVKFFNELYGPAEKDSQKVYKIRSVILTENNDQNMTEEICTKNERRNDWVADTPRSYEPLRAMEKISSFGLAEYLQHCRYLFSELFIEEQRQNQKQFLNLPENVPVDEYCNQVLKQSLKCIKSEDLSQMKRDQFFRAINIFLESGLIKFLAQNVNSTRNEVESHLNSEYIDKKEMLSDMVVSRLEKKSQMDEKMDSKATLIKKWMNRFVCLSDFQNGKNDLKLVTGMRLGSCVLQKTEISLSNFQETIQTKIIRLKKQLACTSTSKKQNDQENGTFDKNYGLFDEMSDSAMIKHELDKLDVIKNVMELKEILKNYKIMIGHHILLANFIIRNFEHILTYRLACSITLEELTCSEQHLAYITDTEDLKNQDQSLKNEKLIFLKNFRKDAKKVESLRSHFENLKSSWQQILKHREEYNDLFDFRFLCHAQELPQEKIDSLLNASQSKLIGFIPSPKYPSCLFMMGALQTLAKIQNTVLQNLENCYWNVNYSKIEILDLNSRELIETSESLEDLTYLINLEEDFGLMLQTVTYTDLQFNRDSKDIQDLDLLSDILAQKLLKGKKAIMTDKFNFQFANEFGVLYNNIQLLDMHFGGLKTSNIALYDRCKIEENGIPELDVDQIIITPDNYQEIYGKFAQYLSMIAEGIEKIKSSKGKSKVDSQPINQLPALKLFEKSPVQPNLSTIDKLYNKIEQYAFNHINIDLDPEYLAEPSTEIVQRLASSRILDDVQVKKLKYWLVRLIMTQLVSSTNDRIGEMNLMECVKWSELGEDEFEIIQIVNRLEECLGIDENTTSDRILMMKHADWVCKFLS